MLTSYQAYGPAEVFPGLIVAPNGGLVHFVHSSGAAALDLLPSGMAAPAPGSFQTSIATAGGMCRANRGDQIMVLPGHVETVATASAWATLPAGVSIRGMSEPGASNRPTINFTAAGSTLVLPANTTLDNFVIDLCATAATVVAAPFSIATSGVKITRNRIHLATSATQLATAPFTVPVGGDFCTFAGNHFWTTGVGTFATNPTNNVLVTGAVAGFQFLDNRVYGGTAGATGQLQFSAAALDVLISSNRMVNAFATSTANITGFAGCTGIIEYNSLSVGNTAGAIAAQCITVPGNMVLIQNFGADGAGLAGALIGTPAA